MKEDIRLLQQQITTLVQAFEHKHDVNVDEISIIATEYPHNIKYEDVNRDWLTDGVKVTIKL